MATQDGPKYPGIEDGLVFSTDPKNRICWNGGTTITDVKDTSRTGTFENTTGDSDDEYGGALTTEGYFDFDGTNDKIPFPYDSTLELQDISVEAWVNWNGTAGNQGYIDLMADNSTNGWFFGIWSSNFVWYIRSSTWDIRTATTTPVADTWYHIVGTVSTYGTSNNMKLYINTVMENEGTTTAAIAYSTSNLVIGEYHNNEWNGLIGPVNIYNRALTSGEVLTNYNRLKGRFGL